MSQCIWQLMRLSLRQFVIVNYSFSMVLGMSFVRRRTAMSREPHVPFHLHVLRRVYNNIIID